MDTPPELVLSRYSVGGRLAAGVAGTVVGAVDTATGRAVAVKFFDGSDDNFSAWIQEVRLAMRLRHPNIPACINAGHDAAWGLNVLVFERALGGSLRRALAGGRRFSAAEGRRVLADVAAALAYAHAHGVIHRDIKPENILAGASPGEPPWLLTDFGAGQFLPRGAVARTPAGSLEYMAPEVMTTGADATSDQYSLGVVGIELRLGRAPDPRARSAFRLERGDDGGLDGLIVRLADPDPERRIPGLTEAAAALTGDGPFDVTATRDGSRFTLIGEDVLARRAGSPSVELVGRLPGSRRFLNAWGDATAVLATADRLVALSPFPRAVAASAPASIFFVDAEQTALWCIEDGGLAMRRLAGGLARAPVTLPPAWPRARRLLGIHAADGQAVLGARGSDVLAWAAPADDGVRARLGPAPGPLHDIRRIGGRTVVLCGDADHAVVAEVVGDGLQEVARVAQAVDTLRVEARAGGLAVAALTPALVHVEEDA